VTTFIEETLPETIRLGLVGGPAFLTEIGVTKAGWSSRNIARSVALRKWRIEYVKGRTDFDSLLAFFHVMYGAAIPFRVRDPLDYEATTSNGFIGSGAGTGLPTYQLAKRYAVGSNYYYRDITKPRSSGFTGYRAASPLTVGASPGNISVSTTTGIVTFVADDTEAITGHTVGATHRFTTAADIPALGIGDKVYLSGITGTGADVLNGLAHTISNKVAGSPTEYIWTIAANTSGSPTLTASGGTAYAYPQADEALTWAGVFDVPAAFATDEFTAEALGNDMFSITNMLLEEVRV
jgi:uncharacterized protein (TIGR02217 family)